jgi:SAM-dependent methyltransferase
MGITLSKLQDLRSRGIFPTEGRVLDIGSSNLYSADMAALQTFAGAFHRQLDPLVAERLASGSTYGSGITRNESFVGDLLERVGLGYLALDIANGYKTLIFDLNHETIPEDLAGSFDVVLNFGTTEHVINQLNAMKVIHDATKVGGHIVHELPTVGYVDHGYFCYTPRFFFDLAIQNDYEVIEFNYQGPADGSDIRSIVRTFAGHFPSLSRSKTFEIKPPNISSWIILRKTENAPFYVSLETTTSVFTSNDSVGDHKALPYQIGSIRSMSFNKLTRYWLYRLKNGIKSRIGWNATI